ncbi:MAG: hypothetical protein DRJ13_17970 [Bacteroidetes bacterium]|nr:MAG: hypothetical protein DRJ13_17970 [Bacteroidota bacterium]
MTVATIERVTILEPVIQPEILTLSPLEIDLVLADEAAKPKRPADPCLLECVSEGFSDEPITEYQDSMDAAGYPYW